MVLHVPGALKPAILAQEQVGIILQRIHEAMRAPCSLVDAEEFADTQGLKPRLDWPTVELTPEETDVVTHALADFTASALVAYLVSTARRRYDWRSSLAASLCDTGTSLGTAMPARGSTTRPQTTALTSTTTFDGTSTPCTSRWRPSQARIQAST